MLFKIGFLKNFAIFTGKHLLVSLFNKVAGLQTSPVADSNRKNYFILTFK